MASADFPESRAVSFSATQSNNHMEGSSPSATAWGAIVAGAVVAAAASLILLTLGLGLGLSSISPWPQKGVQANTFGFASIAWVIVTQLCASALGGYVAGRLRTRWLSTHSDEVYFRDTAHGLIAWALASLVTATVIMLAAFGAIGTAARVSAAGPMPYLIDSLFRKDTATTSVAQTEAEKSNLPTEEVSRIFANSIHANVLPPQDVRHLGQLISARTGLSQADAERRVSDTFNALQAALKNVNDMAADAAEKARKAGIQASLWLFIALLSGAFVASYTATLGGRERDA